MKRRWVLLCCMLAIVLVSGCTTKFWGPWETIGTEMANRKVAIRVSSLPPGAVVAYKKVTPGSSSLMDTHGWKTVEGETPVTVSLPYEEEVSTLQRQVLQISAGASRPVKASKPTKKFPNLYDVDSTTEAIESAYMFRVGLDQHFTEYRMVTAPYNENDLTVNLRRQPESVPDVRSDFQIQLRKSRPETKEKFLSILDKYLDLKKIRVHHRPTWDDGSSYYRMSDLYHEDRLSITAENLTSLDEFNKELLSWADILFIRYRDPSFKINYVTADVEAGIAFNLYIEAGIDSETGLIWNGRQLSFNRDGHQYSALGIDVTPTVHGGVIKYRLTFHQLPDDRYVYYYTKRGTESGDVIIRKRIDLRNRFTHQEVDENLQPIGDVSRDMTRSSKPSETNGVSFFGRAL